MMPENSPVGAGKLCMPWGPLRGVATKLLQKPLMRQLRSKKGQDRTLPASLRMRYKAVAQKNCSTP